MHNVKRLAASFERTGKSDAYRALVNETYQQRMLELLNRFGHELGAKKSAADCTLATNFPIEHSPQLLK
jgi:hypothetical protein